MENTSEIWQASVNGQVYETNFDELIQWIDEGALLQQDKIRRGNLRWIEAGKVPVLQSFFDAKLKGIKPSSVNFGGQLTISNVHSNTANTKKCVLHSSSYASFECSICANFFCEECLSKSFSELSNCPMCGAICKKINLPEEMNFSSLNPDFETKSNIAANPISNIQPNLPIKKSEKNQFPKKTQKVGVFSIISLAILLSLPIAYLWGYQLSEPDIETEKKLPKILILEEVYNTEKKFEEMKLNQDQNNAQKQIENPQSLSKSNELSSSSPEGCFKEGTTEPIKCDENLMKKSRSMAQSINESAKNLEKMQNNGVEAQKSMPSMLPPTAPPPSKAKEKFDQESKIIIEDYRNQTNLRKFWMTFMISFFGIGGLLFAKRKLVNK